MAATSLDSTALDPDRARADGTDFDVVVVGSGFGGSVTTYRQAAAGRTVCLLERGHAYPPGSFPRRPSEVSRSLWDPSEGLRGLFDIWSFRKLDAVVAAGLGGGSLIYANVLLRKDEQWFDRPLPGGGRESWPVTRADLDPDYDLVEQMLTPTPFPEAFTGSTAKASAMARAARVNDLVYERVPLAITFSTRDRVGEAFDDGSKNLHGAPRQTCTNCGGCDLGCNTGSKNTLDLTYLSQADRRYADIRTDCEVRSFRPIDGGWEVLYVDHSEAEEGANGLGAPGESVDLRLHRLRARQLVLSAGSLGSTFLLLRNRAALPAISDRLGQAFSGNGDYLGFFTRAPSPLHPSVGPVITGAVRVPDTADGGEGPGMYLEDGGYLDLFDWLGEMIPPLDIGRRFGRLLRARVSQALLGPGPTRISKEVAQLVGDAHQSSGRLPLLAMGRDCPDGLLRLQNGYLELDSGPGSAAYFRSVEDQLRLLADTLGAHYQPGLSALLSRYITVHPLGGAAMAEDPARGVVDSHGEVFGHPGLFVVDGAMMPGPVGANPSMTIAAMAERCSRHLIEQAAA